MKGSMYGTFTYIYHKNQANAGKYTILDPMGMKIYVITLQVVFSILEIKRQCPCFHVIQKIATL